jgi:hypothetical protein
LFGVWYFEIANIPETMGFEKLFITTFSYILFHNSAMLFALLELWHCNKVKLTITVQEGAEE